MATATATDTGIAALIEHGAACVRVARMDKKPLGTAWDKSASRSLEDISAWLDAGYNVGLLCGSGGIIDIEYDDADGKRLLSELGLANVVTPTWSSSRGQHRLFRLVDPMPTKGWAKIGGLEIRLGGKPAQSVLPPSVHQTGKPYRWIVSPADVAPAEVTLSALAMEDLL